MPRALAFGMTSSRMSRPPISGSREAKSRMKVLRIIFRTHLDVGATLHRVRSRHAVVGPALERMTDPPPDLQSEPGDRADQQRIDADAILQRVERLVDALVDEADRADLDADERVLACFCHLHFSIRMRGSSADRNPSPTRLQATTTLKIARPGKCRNPPCAIKHVAALCRHQPPFGRRRLRSEAEEAQAGSDEDGVADLQRAQHQHGRIGIDEHVENHDTPSRVADDARRLDIGQFLDRQNGAAYEPGIKRHRRNSDGDHHVADARAERGDHHEREQNAR